MIARSFVMRAAVSDAAGTAIARGSDRESSEEVGAALLAMASRTPDATV